MKIKDYGDNIKITYGCIYVFRNKLNGNGRLISCIPKMLGVLF